jgi:uncharacterized Zn finger protein
MIHIKEVAMTKQNEGGIVHVTRDIDQFECPECYRKVFIREKGSALNLRCISCGQLYYPIIKLKKVKRV